MLLLPVDVGTDMELRYEMELAVPQRATVEDRHRIAVQGYVKSSAPCKAA